MRTRRSWRNQDRLFRELGGRPEKPPVLTAEQRIANLRAFIASPFHSRRARAKAERDLVKLVRQGGAARRCGMIAQAIDITGAPAGRATSLAYFVQRNDCAWCGYWRRVPLQRGANRPELRNRLTARGYIVREIPA